MRQTRGKKQIARRWAGGRFGRLVARWRSVRGALRQPGGVEPEVRDHEVAGGPAAFGFGDREGHLGLARPGLDDLPADGHAELLLATGGAVVGRDHEAVEFDVLGALVDDRGGE